MSWLHCLSDVSTAGSRVLSQTVYRTLTYVSFTVCIVFWILLRNYCIPLISYLCWQMVIYPPELRDYQMAPTILNIMLSALCVMHVYWLVLFLKMMF